MPGKYLIYFNKQFNYKIYGFDNSVEGLKLTRANLKKNKVIGKIFYLDVFKLPKKLNNSFDILLSAGFIEHFSDPSKIIDIFFNLIKKKGYIISIVPNTNNCLNTLLMKFFNRTKYINFKKNHLEMNMKDLRKYHKNFKIIFESRIVGFFPTNVFTYDNLFSRILKKILNKLLFINAKLVSNYRFFKFDFFTSHFIIIGKK